MASDIAAREEFASASYSNMTSRPQENKKIKIRIPRQEIDALNDLRGLNPDAHFLVMIIYFPPLWRRSPHQYLSALLSSCTFFRFVR